MDIKFQQNSLKKHKIIGQDLNILFLIFKILPKMIIKSIKQYWGVREIFLRKKL